MELPTPVAGVCTTFLAAVPDGLVTGLYLRDADVTAFAAYVVEQGVAPI